MPWGTALAYYRRGHLHPIAEVSLNQTSENWHPRGVTLNAVKGLARRCSAPLSMTGLNGHDMKCPNVIHYGLAPLNAHRGSQLIAPIMVPHSDPALLLTFHYLAANILGSVTNVRIWCPVALNRFYRGVDPAVAIFGSCTDCTKRG